MKSWTRSIAALLSLSSCSHGLAPPQPSSAPVYRQIDPEHPPSAGYWLTPDDAAAEVWRWRRVTNDWRKKQLDTEQRAKLAETREGQLRMQNAVLQREVKFDWVWLVIAMIGGGAVGGVVGYELGHH